MAGNEEINMTQIVLENIRDNGSGAQFNRDIVIGHISGDLQDKETELRIQMMPEIEKANASFKLKKITEAQRDLVVKSITDQLARQAALNERIMAKRR